MLGMAEMWWVSLASSVRSTAAWASCLRSADSSEDILGSLVVLEQLVEQCGGLGVVLNGYWRCVSLGYGAEQ